MEESDAAAVARAQAGDTEGFRLLVERHSHAIFRLAYRMTGNESDAEDLVQETFLRAHRQLGRFESRANFSTWLYRIAMNCSLDHLKSRKRLLARSGPADSEGQETFRETASQEAAPDRLVISKQVRQKVDATLAELGALEKAAFVMRHYEGLSIDEIARAMDRPNGAVRQSIFRAVQKMRQALQPFVCQGRITTAAAEGAQLYGPPVNRCDEAP